MICTKSRHFKNFISRLMFGVYFFALFSQTFHEHDFSDTLKTLNLKKSENTLTKSDAKESKGDCLACHFISTGNTLLPEEFTFKAIQHSEKSEQIFTLQEKIWAQTKYSFQLRGPPAIS
ncbi:hypothetical protein [Chryseobacterium echinoideorum]|uniref:hypothetical protein n=1 Tax=Chryseobacterium echinoideorum TaxID=1549648 RepID=UPI0011867E0B|nr:hypothetical protein [Chryseobacterium echinoideorum]